MASKLNSKEQAYYNQFSNNIKNGKTYQPGVKYFDSLAAKSGKMNTKETHFLDYYTQQRANSTETKDPNKLRWYNNLVDKYNLKPQMYEHQTNFVNQYTRDLKAGKADTSKLDWYNNLQKEYGFRKATIDNKALQQMSIKALQGDKKAQEYMKTMGYDPLTGKNLWNGVDANTIKGTSAFSQYRKDNPLADASKEYDMKYYEQYNDMIKNNKPMSKYQEEWYNDTVKRWGLDDYNNPYIQQQDELKDLEQSQLDAQDQALNNSMATMDANNFQQFQALNQQLSDKGMAASGIGADALARMQMGANRDYQDAYVQATQNKADIQSGFFDKRASVDQLMQEQAMQEQELALQKDQLAAQNDQANADRALKQDQFLTQQTGTVYVGGKQMLYKGKPITTMELMKLTETQRHNLATENNTSVKNLLDYQASLNRDATTAAGNQLDYQLGLDKNAITREGNQLDYNLGLDKNNVQREKINADLTAATAKLELDYAKLDFNYKKLESNNKIAQSKIDIAAANAQTSKEKNQITALGKQLDDTSRRIANYQKAGKKPSNTLVKKHNETLDALNEIIGASFSSGSGGGGSASSTGLGSLSARYESSGNGGAIGRNAGDIGGASYGKYQLTTASGNAQSFANSWGGSLKGKRAGTAAFDTAWKAEYKKNPTAFTNAQHNYIAKTHYQPTLSKIKQKTGLDLSRMPKAVQDVIWSAGVQHGSSGAANLFKNAGVRGGDSAKTIIDKVYRERLKVDKYFSSSSQAIKNSVANRFRSEWKDALAML